MFDARAQLIIVLSDGAGNEGARRLLPTDVGAIAVQTIEFNPTPTTLLERAVRRVLTLAGLAASPLASPDVVAHTIAEAGGDVRYAINATQFFAGGVVSLGAAAAAAAATANSTASSSSASTSNASKRKRAASSKAAAAAAAVATMTPQVRAALDDVVVGRDATPSLFSALGKILHCKRRELMAPPTLTLPRVAGVVDDPSSASSTIADAGAAAAIDAVARAPLAFEPEKVLAQVFLFCFYFF